MNAQPKPKPKLLDKREARAAMAAMDRVERERCRKRSMGQCEVVITRADSWAARIEQRCPRRASQNHHLISGSGKRNTGGSILAAHRLDVCDLHHTELHAHVLVPVNPLEREDAAAVRYRRVR